MFEEFKDSKEKFEKNFKNEKKNLKKRIKKEITNQKLTPTEKQKQGLKNRVVEISLST